MAGTSDAPYVGPRPFERADQRLFFGRDGEAAALASLVIAHPVVLLYAQSGAGKSSLLNAEVAPRLSNRGCEVLPTMRVGGEVPVGIALAAIPNIYVFNALMSLAAGRAGAALARPASIGDYLRAQPYPATTKGGACLRVLIFDQFEEVFTSFAERWNDRTAFFDDVGAALEEDPRLRVIFAMREEYIGGMDSHAARLPERLRTRLRLERLGAEAALLAVTKPLSTTSRTFKPEAARKLVDNLLKVPIKSATGVTDVSGEFVEPLHLQLVCTKLWSSLPPEVREIDERYIEDLGDVDEALAYYYESCVREIVAETGVDEGTLRAWFERTLITGDGVRGIVPKGAEATGGLANDILDRLQQRYLIRVEMRGLNPWYELTHDRFVAPIRRCNERWRSAAGVGAVSTLELEARAQRWAQEGRLGADLLAGDALGRAKALLAAPALKAFGVPDSVKEYVQASELADSARRRWRDRIVMAGVAGIVAVVAWVLYEAKSRAEDATAVAQGDVARKFAQQGLEFDAVLYGMRAVHPGLDERRGPPREAIDGLRAALRAFGHDPWLRGLPGPAADVAIAPDGRHALARSRDIVCAWDTDTGKALYACLNVAQEGSEADVYFSPDRRWVYRLGRAGLDDAAQMWNARTGARVFEPQLAGTREVALARDGAWAAAYGPATGIRILDLARGDTAATLQRTTADLSSVAIAPTGTSLATVATNGNVELWRPGRGRVAPAPFFAGGVDSYISALYAPDASRIAITAVDFGLNQARSHLHALEQGEPVGRRVTLNVDLPPFSRFALEFAPDARTVTTLTTAVAKVWDAATGAELAQLLIPAGADAKLNDDGRLLITQRQEGRTRLAVVDPRTGATVVERVIDGDVTDADVARDLRRFVGAGKSPAVRAYPAVATPMQVDSLTEGPLFELACEKVRHQQEFATFDAKVKRGCKADAS